MLPFAIDRTARVAVRLRPDSTIRLLSTFGNQGLTTADAGSLSRGTARGWTKYPLGVLWALQQRGLHVAAWTCCWTPMFPAAPAVLVPRHECAVITAVNELPGGLGAGTWSWPQRAIECAVITAVNELTAAGLDTREMVLATQRAENDFVGAPTGIMDQSASLRGAAGHALFLDCRDQGVRLVPFDAESAGLVHAGDRHEGVAFPRRRRLRVPARLLRTGCRGPRRARPCATSGWRTWTRRAACWTR